MEQPAHEAPRGRGPKRDVPQADEPSTLKDHIAKFGDETTFHGVRFATNYKLSFVRRLLWLCIVLGMTSYLTYGVTKSVLTFYGRPVTSIVKINYVHQIPFPAVTFCNYNQWKKSLVPPKLYEALRSLNPYDKNPVNVMELKYHDSLNLTEALKKYTHQIEDMLVECSFKGKACSGDNFTQIMADFGICYSFNSDPERVEYVHQSGSHNALFMQINIQQDEYIFGENNAAGIKLLVHPQGQRPLVKELGVAVPPGYETLVGMELKQVINLKEPYESNCTDGDLQHSKNYTVPLCQFEHRVAHITQACGCRDMRYPGTEDECPLSKYYTCVQPAEASFTANDKSFDCRIPCNLTIYKPCMSFAYYPGQHRLEELLQQTNFTETAIRKNLMHVRIYFEELSYNKVEEVPAYTFLSLQSSIGGYMGLLIGASLITVFEFLDFILVTMGTYFKKYSERVEVRRHRVTVSERTEPVNTTGDLYEKS